MNEVSIIINGVRYDAVKAPSKTACNICCDLYDVCESQLYSLSDFCNGLDLTCIMCFKKSDKKFEQKCCGNCKHLKSWCEKQNCFTPYDNTCEFQSHNSSGWTEITPDNVDEIECIEQEKLSSVGLIIKEDSI